MYDQLWAHMLSRSVSPETFGFEGAEGAVSARELEVAPALAFCVPLQMQREHLEAQQPVLFTNSAG